MLLRVESDSYADILTEAVEITVLGDEEETALIVK